MVDDHVPAHARDRPRAAEITGELPAFVADAIADSAVELTEEDEETIEALVSLGVDEDEARRAVRTGRVPLVLTQQLFSDRRSYTLARIAGKSGVPESVLGEIRAALGLPVVDRYGRNELEWAREVAKLLETIPVDTVIRGTRSRGQAAWSMAMSDLALIRDELVIPLRQSGADDLTVAVALAEMARRLEPISEKLVVATYRMVLEHVLSTEVAALAARGHEPEIDIAVGFVDVVGYTALSARIDPQGLDEVLDRFESRVIEVAASALEVAVVKYLGDAAMLVAPDTVTLVRVLLDLVRPIEALEEAPLRAGVASGPVLVREGDYYGSAVNLAARLTDRARPWSLLADPTLQDDLEELFDVKRIPPVRLRGLGTQRPLVVRWLEGPTSEEE
ncbi:MAG: adenylate/guanylate cyclase domain-containing protein [Actinobacteria bacterium]|nr:adenylate/guanylate cyclase domain-containing protein [Actinomycetota bacterium]